MNSISLVKQSRGIYLGLTQFAIIVLPVGSEVALPNQP